MRARCWFFPTAASCICRQRCGDSIWKRTGAAAIVFKINLPRYCDHAPAAPGSIAAHRWGPSLLTAAAALVAGTGVHRCCRCCRPRRSLRSQTASARGRAPRWLAAQSFLVISAGLTAACCELRLGTLRVLYSHRQGVAQGYSRISPENHSEQGSNDRVTVSNR